MYPALVYFSPVCATPLLVCRESACAIDLSCVQKAARKCRTVSVAAAPGGETTWWTGKLLNQQLRQAMDFAGNFPLLLVLVCLSRAQPDRCPPFSNSGSGSASGLVSGDSGSGSGLDTSCVELERQLRSREGVLPALNYFCRHVFSSPSDCETPSCRTCRDLLACEAPSSPSDVCSSDILGSCSIVQDVPYVDDLYDGVCNYAMSTCLNDSSTGICESQMLQSCSAVHRYYYLWPCDCFLPSGLCELCSVILPLCPDASGSGFSGGSGGSGSGSGVSDFCSYFESEEGMGYLFLCQSIPAGGDCPYSNETCSICFYLRLAGCRDFPQVTISDLCALPRLVTTCDYPSVVSQSPFFSEICSYITISDCGRNDSTCVGSHCQLCNFLSSGEGVGYLFLCQSVPTGSYCPYSNETCSLCPFIASGVCTNLPLVSHSDLCKLSRLVTTCEYFISTQYQGETEFFSDICPFVSTCVPSGSGSGSGFFSGYGSGSGSGSGGDLFCSFLEFQPPGLLYYCLSSFSAEECSTQIICDFCEHAMLCPNLTLPSRADVCLLSDSISPCFRVGEDVNDYCSVVMRLCLASGDSGVCQQEELINNCTGFFSSLAGNCSEPEFAPICRHCFSLLELCMPQSSATPLPSVSVVVVPAESSSALSIPTGIVGPIPTRSSLIAALTTTTLSISAIQTTMAMVPTSSSLPVVLPSSTVPIISSSLPVPPVSQTSSYTVVIAVSSSSEMPTSAQPSPTASTPTFPEGTAIDVDQLSEEQAENTVSLEIEDITVADFLEKELSFRESIALALNKAINRRRKRQDDELTAEDITYVGVPVRTEDGAVLVAFFAEAPSGGLVEGSVLARILEDNRNDISDAAGGKVRDIKKGVPEALQPQGSTDSDHGDDEDDGDGGLSGGAVAAIVVVLLVVVVLAVVVLVAGLLLWYRRHRKSYEISTSAGDYSAIDDPDEPGDEGGRGGTGRAFPLRPGSQAYVAVPAQSSTTDRGAVEATEEEPKISHL